MSEEIVMLVSSVLGRHGIAGAAWLLFAGAAFAQEAPKNLQVLPKDWTRPQVVQVMQNFTTALSVGCDFCHAIAPPDFASDEKKEKVMARAMMKITQDLNARLPKDFNKEATDVTQIGCITCHRGVPVPKQLSEILAKASADKGFAAAAARYDDLKSRFYGAQAYDFSESGLILTATPLIANRTDEAIQFLNMNLKMFPQSALTYIALARAQAAKKDNPAAIASLEKALALDPRNNQAQRLLAELKK
jgi:tetratricopeptide (TPR) repeat protein